ncbi:cob(I)yrinic acid a,c-diamide adenosyltransferase [uncultured Clostridium sp.]|uniref:cob(I)yrinic acid a,c-diamide adenosyltransferase n=1 Tax=uncultured Clostridium sp. TaxID=59620 RepID=UPI0025DEA088|nr:cob(I)yrinic acid a,c-diamide adenosyltransferase [uncultured Clostridium sp.]
MNKGLIHIYCGDGKGKTTASIGLSVRAVGSGMKVIFTQFLKNNKSSELKVLKTLPNLEVVPCEKAFGFFKFMSDEEKKKAKEVYSRLLTTVINKAIEEDIDLLVLDEIMATYNYELIDKEYFLNFLKNKPEKLEVVMTGRDPKEELINLANYVSNIEKIKHPFDEGIMARVGIEM